MDGWMDGLTCLRTKCRQGGGHGMNVTRSWFLYFSDLNAGGAYTKWS